MAKNVLNTSIESTGSQYVPNFEANFKPSPKKSKRSLTTANGGDDVEIAGPSSAKQPRRTDNSTSISPGNNDIQNTVESVSNAASEYHKQYVKEMRTGWKPGELRALRLAMKQHGSQDFEQLSKAVRSKTAEQIQDYIRYLKNEMSREESEDQDSKIKGLKIDDTKPNPIDGTNNKRTENAAIVEKNTAAERKKFTTYEELQAVITKVLSSRGTVKDFSCELSHALLQEANNVKKNSFKQQFGVNNSLQTLEFHKIYSFLGCVLKGHAPPNLSPLEAAIVLEFMRELRQKVDRVDLTEPKAHFQRVLEAYRQNRLEADTDLQSPWEKAQELNIEENDEEESLSLADLHSINPLCIPTRILAPVFLAATAHNNGQEVDQEDTGDADSSLDRSESTIVVDI